MSEIEVLKPKRAKAKHSFVSYMGHPLFLVLEPSNREIVSFLFLLFSPPRYNFPFRQCRGIAIIRQILFTGKRLSRNKLRWRRPPVREVYFAAN